VLTHKAPFSGPTTSLSALLSISSRGTTVESDRISMQTGPWCGDCYSDIDGNDAAAVFIIEEGSYSPIASFRDQFLPLASCLAACAFDDTVTGLYNPKANSLQTVGSKEPLRT
jgi:hypothetical protein